MDKPLYVDYETRICASALNAMASTVWDALGQATNPQDARTFIGAIGEAPQDGTSYARQNAQWVQIAVGNLHNDLSGRSSSDAHPVSAITGLQSDLDQINLDLSGKAPSSASTATGTSFTPAGSIVSANVQAALAELDGDVTANAGAIAALDGSVVKRTSATGAALIPAGGDAQRDTSVLGAFRYNSQRNEFEGLSNVGWVQVGGSLSSLPASAVTFIPSGTIVATNTQAAVEEVSGDVTALSSTVSTKIDRAGDTMTGQLNGITPVGAANLTRKDYVDSKGVDVIVGSSGIALKFPDGTLVCYISNSVVAGTWTASSPAGYFYASFGGIGNYPVAFIANPTLMGFANEQTVAARGMYVANLSTSLAACTGGFYVSPLNTAPASVAAVAVSVIAVGRWKV